MELTSIRLHDVQLELGQPPQQLLTDINLDLRPGINCILGPNGAGKTLINRILGLIQEVSSGTVHWNDRIVNPLQDSKIEDIRKIGYMRQEPVFVNRNVRDNLALPLVFRDEDKIDELVEHNLIEFSLKDIAEKYIRNLSTGQKHRVALARTLITEPELIILDEPTASLDLKTTKWFEEMIQISQKYHQKIIVWTTHDQFQVKRIADTVSIILDGRFRATGSIADVLYEQNDPKIANYLAGELIEYS